MPNTPQFNYFLSSIKNQVQKDDKIWKSAIPVSLKPPKETLGFSFSYGDYFTAAQSFLSANNRQIIITAISQFTNQRITLSDIKGVNIFQEKHGEFYHPARVETIVGENKYSFVLNVALSETGKNCMKREYELLQRLSTKFKNSYIPNVYGRDEICLDHNLKIDMFLGQWFEGYHE